MNADSIRSNVDKKEKELNALREKLIPRERVEIQNLLDEHRSVLEKKKQDFESELKEKRKLFEEENKVKLNNLDNKVSEINHMEEKLNKREHALWKKSDRVKDREKENESKLKDLKEKEKALKLEEKNLVKQRKELFSERESLQALKDEVKLIKSEISQKQLQIQDETENVSVLDDERKEHNRLIQNLKQEMEKYRRMNDLLCKESDDLKVDRKKFEDEWENLDEERAELTRDLEKLKQEKKMIEKFKEFGEKQLEEEKVTIEGYIKREREKLKLERESFTARMKHEEFTIFEKARFERNQLLHEYESRKRDLETNMLNKQEEMERALYGREREFEEKMERENHNISRLKELTQKEMENMELEKSRLEREKQNNALNKRQLEEQQLEMQNDINELDVLSQKLKLQREKNIKERSQFISFIDTLKSCQNCGNAARDYMLFDFQKSELDDKEASPLFEKVALYELTGTAEEYCEVQEVSVELTKSRRKSVQKTRDRVQRTHSVKAVVEDAGAFLGQTSGDGKKNRDVAVSVNEESRGDSTIVPRKRTRPTQSSKITGGSQDGYDNEGHSESVAIGGHRKRHQTGPPSMQNTGNQRYNLRRHSKGKGVAASTDTKRKTDKEAGDDTMLSRDNEITSALPEEFTSSQIGNPAELVQVTLYKNLQTRMVSSVERVARFRTTSSNIDENADATSSTDNVELSEVSGTPEYNHDELEDGDENPGEASIPRKLWAFFTS
ncbi:hypothetical protein OROGR_014867 [Orobanche gracilis]